MGVGKQGHNIMEVKHLISFYDCSSMFLHEIIQVFNMMLGFTYNGL